MDPTINIHASAHQLILNFILTPPQEERERQQLERDLQIYWSYLPDKVQKAYRFDLNNPRVVYEIFSYSLEESQREASSSQAVSQETLAHGLLLQQEAKTISDQTRAEVEKRIGALKARANQTSHSQEIDSTLTQITKELTTNLQNAGVPPELIQDISLTLIENPAEFDDNLAILQDTFSSLGISQDQLAQNLEEIIIPVQPLLTELNDVKIKEISESKESKDIYIYAVNDKGDPVEIPIHPDLVPTRVLTESEINSSLNDSLIPQAKGVSRNQALTIAANLTPALQLKSIGLNSASVDQIATEIEKAHPLKARELRHIAGTIKFIENHPSTSSSWKTELPPGVRFIVSYQAISQAPAEVRLSTRDTSQGPSLNIANSFGSPVTDYAKNFVIGKTKTAGLDFLKRRVGIKAGEKLAETGLKTAAGKLVAKGLEKAGISLLGQAVAAPLTGGLSVAIQLGAEALSLAKNFIKDRLSDLGIKVNEFDAKKLFGIGAATAIGGMVLIGSGLLIPGAILLGLGGVVALANLPAAIGIASSLFGGIGSSIVRFPSLLLAGSTTSIAAWVSISLGTVAFVAFFIVITSHSAFLANSNVPGAAGSQSQISPGLPGSSPSPECNGAGIPKPSATDIRRGGNYAFPLTPFSQTYYGCSHWDGTRATDIGIVGDTAANPPKGAHLPIVAYTSGRVTSVVNNDSKGGKYIILAGDDGRYYYYAHNCSIYVTSGQHVSVGEVIATSDNTGSAATTVEHLHFAISDTPNFMNGGSVCPSTDFESKFKLNRCIPARQCI